MHRSFGMSCANTCVAVTSQDCKLNNTDNIDNNRNHKYINVYVCDYDDDHDCSQEHFSFLFLIRYIHIILISNAKFVASVFQKMVRNRFKYKKKIKFLKRFLKCR